MPDPWTVWIAPPGTPPPILAEPFEAPWTPIGIMVEDVRVPRGIAYVVPDGAIERSVRLDLRHRRGGRRRPVTRAVRIARRARRRELARMTRRRAATRG